MFSSKRNGKSLYISRNRYAPARKMRGSVLLLPCLIALIAGALFLDPLSWFKSASATPAPAVMEPAKAVSEAPVVEPKACPPKSNVSLNNGVLFASTSKVTNPESMADVNDIVAGGIPEPDELGVEHITAKVEKGDTASSILSDYLTYPEIIAMADSCKDTFSLTCLRVGKPYTIVTENDAFKSFEYQIDQENKLIVTKTEDGFQAENKKLHFDLRTRLVQGTINSSLFKSVTDEGETPELAVRLAEIFAWEIDFIRDIRKGDSFRVLVEKRSRNGKDMGYGRIFAVQFVNQDELYEGYLYTDADENSGYYTAEGKNLQKAFLKAPLSFRRISSGFNLHRMHPILHVVRAHPAIDYAAPTGTPVMAIGDGTVTAKKYSNGAGNYIKVRHPNGYESAYMHLSKFARGLAVGQKVRQSDVIGYVGATGLATGPHLDFRMKKAGKYVNPTKIENVRSEGIGRDQMDMFKQVVAERQAEMTSQLADAASAMESSDMAQQ
ncbi:hypothetical protein DQK91_03850 [Oceanidesulfovibrio marinus]|uniref:Murein DD-endopeptidase MepM and murein hydrolase activator NlpD, contain LysM domain n=2 Tax=Oceanidesulfovibrio marinus TaxID=370038 RepID=A0A6P1ZN24_9BACT|nr:hypothetical protein E8L03_14590 [Oceanidesulfovibrio marinus]TVM35805.1 hypothetical protein DQK91_03850 [Oceanidesulfovibrio marinus]